MDDFCRRTQRKMAFQSRPQLNGDENQLLENVKKAIQAMPPVQRVALIPRNSNLVQPLVRRDKVEDLPLKSSRREAPEVKDPPPKPAIFECVRIKPEPLPANIADIDEGDTDYLEFCSEYAKDIYEYLFSLESKFMVKSQYLDKHPSLRPHMRAILVEWLVSLQARFRLLQETLFTCVSMLDRFMSAADFEVSRSNFQLVGVTCMLLACKYEEMYLPSARDFAFMCDGAYTKDDILKMERVILNTIGFEFAKPLSAHFLRRFSKAGGADSTTHIYAKYLIELALYDYSLVHCKPSVIAAAAVSIAGAVTGLVRWDATMEYYCRYKLSDLDFVVNKLCVVAATASSGKYVKTTYKKYASEKFQSVSRSIGLNTVVIEFATKYQNELEQKMLR